MRLPTHPLIARSLRQATKTSMGHYRMALFTTQTSNDTPTSQETVPDKSIPQLDPLYDDSRMQSKPIHLRTLYRAALQPEDYIDLSDARGVIEGTQEEDATSATVPYITYARTVTFSHQDKRRTIKYSPFPVNARGFFYFTTASHIPLASSLRFRVSQDASPLGFAQGQDLLNPYGTPWQIPLMVIATSPRFKVIREMLLQEGFMPPALLQRCEELLNTAGTFNFGPWSQLIFEPGQPFYLDFSRLKFKIFLVGMETVQWLDARDLFTFSTSPFKSGSILCQFVRNGDRRAYLYVKRIIEPIQYIDGYNGLVDMPAPGKVLSMEGTRMRVLNKTRQQTLPQLAIWLQHERKSSWAWNWSRLRNVAGPGFKYPWDSY